MDMERMKRWVKDEFTIDDVYEVIQKALEEDSSKVEQIILQALIFGSKNGYEGLGILEKCKIEWVDMVETFDEK